jgi:hypothetical protein
MREMRGFCSRLCSELNWDKLEAEFSGRISFRVLELTREDLSQSLRLRQLFKGTRGDYEARAQRLGNVRLDWA